MKKLERFGPEWWAFCAAAWQARWSVARAGGHVHRGEGVIEVIPPNPIAVATMAGQDADDAIAAFNATFFKENP